MARAAAFVVLSVAFVLVRSAVPGTDQPTGREARLADALVRHPPPWMHGWINGFSRNAFAMIVLALAAVALFRRKWLLAGAGVAGCVAAVYAAEHLFKHLLDDYPSAHVTAAAACATFAWYVLRRDRFLSLGTILALAVFAVPLFVAWAVVAQRMHRPVEAVGGLLLGPLVVGLAVAAIVDAGRVLLSAARRGAARRTALAPQPAAVEVEHAS